MQIATTVVRSLILFVFACSQAAHCAPAPISGAGSTAAGPVYLSWAKSYEAATGIKLNYASVGSSAGLAQIKARSVDFGASDFALSSEESKKTGLLCFPTAVSGIVPVVNLPGIKSNELKLTGPVLALIFSRKITQWNDPAIEELNAGVKLPGMPITVVARQDGSGSTFNFTDYLSKVSPQWKSAYGVNSQINWETGTVKVAGSTEVAAEIKRTPGAISYIEFAFVTRDKLIPVKVKNQSGAFVAASIAGFTAALAESTWRTKVTFDDTLTDKPGAGSWPITMGTFVIIPQVTNDPDKELAVLKFFTWSFVHGEEIVGDNAFIRLSDIVQAQVFRLFVQVKDSKGQALPLLVT